MTATSDANTSAAAPWELSGWETTVEHAPTSDHGNAVAVQRPARSELLLDEPPLPDEPPWDDDDTPPPPIDDHSSSPAPAGTHHPTLTPTATLAPLPAAPPPEPVQVEATLARPEPRNRPLPPSAAPASEPVGTWRLPDQEAMNRFRWRCSQCGDTGPGAANQLQAHVNHAH